jgi:DNA (cytosine-5)-methyltransferase 1
MEKLNVLSLFDGMSCGQQALERSGIKYNKYYASEIDKYAIHVTQHNYPDTIQIGSVTEIDVSNLDPIDLLIGGSPCQSFSFAGKRNGMTTACNEEIYTLDRYLELKSDGFQFEGESYLFWEYMRILTNIRKYNPDVLFLLENVEMGSKWERILSEAIGIFGVHINSALVSAQNRKRIYWTNIRVREEGLFGELHSDIPQPEDRGILLKDVLEDNVAEKYYLSDKMLNYFNNRAANFNNGKINIRNENDKATTITASCKSVDISDNFIKDSICVAMRGREAVLTPKRTEYGKAIRKDYEAGKIQEQRKNIQQLEPRQDGKTNTLTSVQKDNLLVIPEVTANRYEGLTEDQQKKFNPDVDASKHNALTQAVGRGGSSSEYMDSVSKVSNLSSRIRRLTPVECERLQTVEDDYSACVSDTQRYKMLGNGWNVETVAHIFSFINNGKT